MPLMASRTTDATRGNLRSSMPETRQARAGRRHSRPPLPRVLAVTLACFLLLSVLLVELRPVAAVSGTLEAVYTGRSWPIAFAFAPDGRMFVAERYSGQILIIEKGTILPDAFYTFDHLGTLHDEGLLGLALDPSFPTAPWVYAYYTFDDGNGTVYNRIVRIPATGNSGGSMEILLDQIPSGVWHIGGPIHFGTDGKLYAVVGDSYIPANAQNLTTVAGKILRLNPDGSVPADNPFVGNGSVNPYIYTYGHRNNFGIAFHPITGDAFVTENGPECNDEVNLLIPGRNYGWGPSWTCQHPPPDPLNTNRDGPNPILPMISYSPNIAPTNAVIYNGLSFPSWRGDLFFGTWNTRNVHRLHLAPPAYDTVVSDQIVVTLPSGAAGGVVDVEVGLDGAIWLSDPDTIYRFYDTTLPPVASFTASPSTPLVGDAMTFDGSGSFDLDGSIASYAWDFGDGASASGVVVSHAYATYGHYIVTLTVTDLDLLTGSQAWAFRVLARPDASFVFGPPLPIEGAPVTFNASISADPDGNIAEYGWTWGDGSSPTVSSSSVGEHTFATFGDYTVNLTVTDSDGLTSATSASVHVFAPPTAVFTSSTTSLLVGQAVDLDASASFDPDGAVVLYAWDFGDNTTAASGANVSHAYAQPGTYLITLQVIDSVGLTDTQSMSVSVARPNEMPVAALAIVRSRVNPHDSVIFNALNSTDPDGSIVSYSWDFGDGTVGDGVAVVHAYTAPGTYSVILTVTDDRGGTDSIVGHVWVNAPPTASFVLSAPPVYPGISVTFDGRASTDSDSPIVSYAWDFGDGSTEQGAVVVHTYTRHGTFATHLVVTDDLGSHDESTKTVDVGNRPPAIVSTSPQAAMVVNRSEPMTFQVNASDSDGDSLTYAWTVNGISVGGGSPTYRFVPSEVGTFVVKVVVSDGSATVSFEWVIEVRDRVTSSGFPWSLAPIGIGGMASVVALIGILLRRRGSR